VLIFSFSITWLKCALHCVSILSAEKYENTGDISNKIRRSYNLIKKVKIETGDVSEKTGQKHKLEIETH